MKLSSNYPVVLIASLLAAGCNLNAADKQWWNPSWTQRQSVTLETDAASVGSATVLVRLHDGNFQFTSAAENGADLRFIGPDGKTPLSYQVESYDSLLNEAFVWVYLPSIEGKQSFNLYFGNTAPDSVKPAPVYDDATKLVYHFSERGAAPTDSSGNGNIAAAPVTISEGSMIGNGLRLLGNNALVIPASASLEWKAAQPITLAGWLKPGALQPGAIVISRGEGAESFQLLLDQGAPVIKVGSRRSEPGTVATSPGVWSHLAIVADGTTIQVFVNGTPSASIDAALPAATSPINLGSTDSGFAGELDEFSISSKARTAGWVQLTAANQGNTDASQRTLSLGQVEGDAAEEKSHLMEHLSLFGDIARNMMFDGWIAIGVCAIMIVIGWTVAIRKFIYLNSIERGTKEFLKKWKSLSTDLTAMDPDDKSNVSSLGGNIDPAQQSLVEKSPLYHIYHIGAEEIRHRLDKDNNRVQGLSGRSIQAIRASLDAGLVHESHRLSDGLVYLTISIAGGPYVGLLGTVVGVMITFAIIAKSGEVNVNSIAPGIASALLATVVGLVVAIPALFIYSYLNGRIKNSLALMQVFIDEFVAKMAEFYRPAQDPDQSTSSNR